MVFESIGSFEHEGEDRASGINCEDPQFIERIREGVCPLCDSPLDLSPEWLAALVVPCSSPICDFVLRPHGKLSRTNH